MRYASIWSLAILTAALQPGAVLVRDIDGRERRPFDPAGAAGVLVFVSSDCPISNGYAPEIQRLCDGFMARGAGCLLVYEDSGITAEGVRSHLREFRYHDVPAVIDADRALAARARVTVTPEVAVVARGGAVRYRGRIDNRYVAAGRPRQVVTSHDLSDALDAVLNGRTVPHAETEAFGCFITPAPPRSLR